MAGAALTYVQKQLGHSSVQITVDLYFHWIKRAERSRTLDVDRLMRQEVKSARGESEGGTSGGSRPIEAIQTNED